MLDDLQILEKTILDLKSRYTITATELANLKHKIANDDSPKKLAILQDELNKHKETMVQMQSAINGLNSKEKVLTEQIEALTEQNRELIKKNQDLTDKNALAISRAEVVQEWLAKIDKQSV